MNVMTMFYDPTVWYKNDLIFNFIKEWKSGNQQNGMYLDNQKPQHNAEMASNGC